MTQEKTGPDATPRIGLDLGRQIFDDPGGGVHEDDQAGADEERIRRRAYEIWEREGRSGDPQDHWYRAERELSEAQEAQSELKPEDPALGEASPGLAQGGTWNVSRPNEVSGRSVADDVEE
jgi:hypothetical protein